jgi:hypothetical protein
MWRRWSPKTQSPPPTDRRVELTLKGGVTERPKYARVVSTWQRAPDRAGAKAGAGVCPSDRDHAPQFDRSEMVSIRTNASMAAPRLRHVFASMPALATSSTNTDNGAVAVAQRRFCLPTAAQALPFPQATARRYSGTPPTPSTSLVMAVDVHGAADARECVDQRRDRHTEHNCRASHPAGSL